MHRTITGIYEKLEKSKPHAMGATNASMAHGSVRNKILLKYSTIRIPVHLLNLVPVLDLVPVPIQQNWYSSTQCSTKYVVELLYLCQYLFLALDFSRRL
jgi:hypothetical protein